MKSTEEKKDLAEKEFIGFPDIAADTINALLYQGRPFTDAGNLRAGPTETAYETFHQEKRKLRSQFEDLCRYELQDGHIKIMYLIANQSKADGRMLLRKGGLQAALIRMIKVLSGDSDIENVEEWLEKQQIREEDEITVCELFDQYERKGRQEGIETGRQEGRREGIETGRQEGRKEGIETGRKEGEARRLVTDIENAMKFFKVTLEKACEGLGTTVGRYEEAKRLL